MKHVVAIDDSQIALQVIEDALDHHDITVFATNDPGEFFRVVWGEDTPDLIITDLEMPNMAGNNICRLLKTDKRTKNVPLVLLSNMENEKLAETARRLGADAYIFKGVFNEEIVLSSIFPLLGMQG